MPIHPSHMTYRTVAVLLTAAVVSLTLTLSSASAQASSIRWPLTAAFAKKSDRRVALAPMPHRGRHHIERNTDRPRAFKADYGTVRSECNRSVPGGGTILGGFSNGYSFGYPIGSEYYARVVAYVGSRFVTLTDWHAFQVANGGATGYSIDANHVVIGGTAAPTSLFGMTSVPAGTWAASGVETWSARGGYAGVHWVTPTAYGLATYGVWCYLP